MAPTPPTSWAAPTNDGTGYSINGTPVRLSYTGGYWFCVTVTTGGVGDNLHLRYASSSDLSGTWTDYGTSFTDANKVFYATPVYFDGTNYAFYYSVRTAGPPPDYTYQSDVYVVHTTNPTSTWTVSAVSTYGSGTLSRYALAGGYFDGNWVFAGSDWITGETFVAYSSTPTGTYTIVDSALSTTDSITDASAVHALDYDGTHWLIGTGAGQWRYASTLGGTWSTLSALDGDQPIPIEYGNRSRMWMPSAGVWLIALYDSGNNYLVYADTVTGTWTEVGRGYVSNAGPYINIVAAVAHNGYYFLAVGFEPSDSAYSYKESASDPSGSWTYGGDAGFSSTFGIMDAVFANDYFVGVDYAGNIRYTYSPAPLTTTSTLLRQRQSPLRTPARVRGVDLRQRQTPYIT